MLLDIDLSDSPMHARCKVLQLPELLEAILLLLPQDDLLKAQQVASSWRHLICHSNALQRNLFYRSELVPLSHDCVHRVCSLLAIERGRISRSGDAMPIADGYQVCGCDVAACRAGWKWSASQDLEMGKWPGTILLNPCMLPIFLHIDHAHALSYGFRMPRSKPAWLEMYISDPPVATIDLLWCVWGTESHVWFSRQNEGIRVKHVLCWLEDLDHCAALKRHEFECVVIGHRLPVDELVYPVVEQYWHQNRKLQGNDGSWVQEISTVSPVLDIDHTCRSGGLGVTSVCPS